jgi:hypothetical protein
VRQAKPNVHLERIMRCARCATDNLKTFNGELAIHFPGWEGLEKPVVWAFPKLIVCVGCGLVQFDLPDEQMAQLKGDDFLDQSKDRTQAS